MNASLITVMLLVISNILMTFAWYGNLYLDKKGISTSWPLWLIILLSWGVALLEYCVMIPANRIGFEGKGGPFSLVQLKVMQEAITLVVFTIFALLLFQGEQIRWNHIAAFLLIIGAVYLVFMK